MSIDPYKSGMLKKNPYASKREVTGQVVAILDFATGQRGLQLISQPSRAVRQGEVHELILTAEASAGPGQSVNAVAYLGFIEIETGGILLQGDQVMVNNRLVGFIAGFDETHTPNHQNIVIRSDTVITGVEAALAIGDQFRFTMVKA
jgi:hypothetical protein